MRLCKGFTLFATLVDCLGVAGLVRLFRGRDGPGAFDGGALGAWDLDLA
jgi:hypothetical protein